jgi:hypothetical protein
MQEFTLKGQNFGDTIGSVSFRYYTQNYSSGGAPIISWSNNEIHAKVPGVKKGYYRIMVVTADNKKSQEVRFTVNNGQPIVNSTSISLVNGKYEMIFQGVEFGYKKGIVNIYSNNNIISSGIINYWSDSRVRFSLPNLFHAQYGFQIQASDGRQSSFKFFTVGN